MKARGLTSIQIGANLGISHITVQRWLKAGAAPAHDKPPQPGSVGPHAPYLEQRWQEGCRNATLFWRELKEGGYRGSERTLRRWLAERRQTGSAPPGDRGRRRCRGLEGPVEPSMCAAPDGDS